MARQGAGKQIPLHDPDTESRITAFLLGFDELFPRQALGERGDHSKREAHWRQLKEQALAALRAVGGVPTGDQELALPNTLNIAIPGLDSEAVMLALKELVAISNGSACTSQNYTASHVLAAMGLPEDHIKGALRLSWSHLTPEVPWSEVVGRIEGLR